MIAGSAEPSGMAGDPSISKEISPPPAAFAAWIAARSVHSGAPPATVPPVSQPYTGSLAGRSPVEFTTSQATTRTSFCTTSLRPELSVTVSVTV